jgi:TM2 domain-containing membrane protein YozV
MNHPSTLSHPPASTATAPMFEPGTGIASHPGAGQPVAFAPAGHAQGVGGGPGFMPAQGQMYPGQAYPQPINIVVQNTNTMSQNHGPVAGALVRVAYRNKWVAAALALLLGWIGAHKFYLGQTGMGIVYLLFCWTFIPLLLSMIETLMLVVSSEREFDVRFNSRLAR